MEVALHFVTTHILPRSVEYATREVIWEPIVELQNLLQGHYYGHPVYKYDIASTVGMQCVERSTSLLLLSCHVQVPASRGECL